MVEILKESYEKALALLRDNRELMDKLAEFLIEKETITGKEFMQIFRKEKGLPDPKEEKEGKGDITDISKGKGEGSESAGFTEAEAFGATEDAVPEKNVSDSVDIPSPIELPDPVILSEPDTQKEEAPQDSVQGTNDPSIDEPDSRQQEDSRTNGTVGRFSNHRLDD